MKSLQTQLKDDTVDESSRAVIEQAITLLVDAHDDIIREGVAPTGLVKTLTRALKNIFKNARTEVLRTSSWEQTSSEDDSDADESKPVVDLGNDVDELSAFFEASPRVKNEKKAFAEEKPKNVKAESVDTKTETYDEDPAAFDFDFEVEGPVDDINLTPIEQVELLFNAGDAASTLEVLAMYIF